MGTAPLLLDKSNLFRQRSSGCNDSILTVINTDCNPVKSERYKY